MRTIDVRSDDDLVTAAAAGNRTAFEELYRRHSDAAWGVAMSVTRDRNDAADAVSDAFTRMFTAVAGGRLVGVPFRPYLLTATRNASIDILRRASRVDPTDEIDDARLPRTRESVTPSDAVLLGAESALVAQAFADLPERWRSVLWLTEVEGMAPREAAEVLGLSANGAAQLAVRARAGLRERYLQAHVGGAATDACRFTIERLGAYVGGALSARDLAKVDQHLAGCDECRARQQELEEVGSTLRRAIVPIPLFLGAAVLGRLSLASSSTGATSATGLSASSPPAPWNPVTKALAGACAGLLTLGVLGVGLRVGEDDVRTAIPAELAAPSEVRGFTLTRPPEAAADVTPLAPPPLPSFDDVARTGGTPPATAPSATPDAATPPPAAPAIGDAATIERDGPAAAPQPAPSSGGATTTPAADGPSDEPAPVAQVDANLGGVDGLTAAVGVGDGSCTGLAGGGQASDDCVTPPTDSTAPLTVEVEVGGEPVLGL